MSKVASSVRSDDPVLNKIESLIAQLEMCEEDIKTYSALIGKRMRVLRDLRQAILREGEVPEKAKESIRRLIENKELVKVN